MVLASKNSLLERIKRMEDTLEPDTIPFPREKRKVIKTDTSWQVAKLTFDNEKEAKAFSKRLEKDGLTAYLDEIIHVLENGETGSKEG